MWLCASFSLEIYLKDYVKKIRRIAFLHLIFMNGFGLNCDTLLREISEIVRSGKTNRAKKDYR
jgi:hypothetical protein